jgi:hypothetical protein
LYSVLREGSNEIALFETDLDLSTTAASVEFVSFPTAR